MGFLRAVPGQEREVWDDRSPTGKPGGLAMGGRVRNWTSFETPNGKPMFKMKSQPEVVRQFETDGG